MAIGSGLGSEFGSNKGKGKMGPYELWRDLHDRFKRDEAERKRNEDPEQKEREIKLEIEAHKARMP